MTDRFYPLGLPAADDVWKTTYEAQNEMRSFERSAYPPGTAIHLPGARDMFGYSTPGPIASRMSKPELNLRETANQSNPREHYAIPRTQAPDEMATFQKHDIPEIMRSYNSPVATMTFSPGMKSTVSRTRSLPALERKPPPPRLTEPNEVVTKLEDDHFTYFVPKNLQRHGQEKIASQTLSKLHKTNPISFPFSGDGTGFKAQSADCDWMTKGHYTPNMATSYRVSYQKPPFYRMSPFS